jgi:hypothetical protein
MTIQEVRAVKGRIAAIDVESQVCTIDGEEVECP